MVKDFDRTCTNSRPLLIGGHLWGGRGCARLDFAAMSWRDGVHTIIGERRQVVEAVERAGEDEG